MAGYSATPLIQKLGIKPGFVIHVTDPPPEYFALISLLPDVQVKQKLTGIRFHSSLYKDQKTFKAAFIRSRKLLQKDGMLWISWPKKSLKVVTDLDENLIRDFGLSEGLVDVKVCGVDGAWSGLKFVIRVKDR